MRTVIDNVAKDRPVTIVMDDTDWLGSGEVGIDGNAYHRGKVLEAMDAVPKGSTWGELLEDHARAVHDLREAANELREARLEAQRHEDSARMAQADADALREVVGRVVDAARAADRHNRTGLYTFEILELLGAKPTPKPPTEPGSVIIADEIEMDEDRPAHGTIVLDSHGKWHGVTQSGDGPLVQHTMISPERIKAWRPAKAEDDSEERLGRLLAASNEDAAREALRARKAEAERDELAATVERVRAVTHEFYKVRGDWYTEGGANALKAELLAAIDPAPFVLPTEVPARIEAKRGGKTYTFYLWTNGSGGSNDLIWVDEDDWTHSPGPERLMRDFSGHRLVEE